MPGVRIPGEDVSGSSTGIDVEEKRIGGHVLPLMWVHNAWSLGPVGPEPEKPIGVMVLSGSVARTARPAVRVVRGTGHC